MRHNPPALRQSRIDRRRDHDPIALAQDWPDALKASDQALLERWATALGVRFDPEMGLAFRLPQGGAHVWETAALPDFLGIARRAQARTERARGEARRERAAPAPPGRC